MKSSVVSLIKLCCLRARERERGERKKEEWILLTLIRPEREINRKEKHKNFIILAPEQARTVLIVFLAYS